MIPLTSEVRFARGMEVTLFTARQTLASPHRRKRLFGGITSGHSMQRQRGLLL